MIEGFTPIVSTKPKIMILGSAPSVKSLLVNEYYGNKRNSFWYILSEIYNHNEFNDYQEKTKFIIDNNIILWDVINTCSREGSLDSKIKDVDVNDIVNIIEKNNSLRVVFFNGKKSFDLYKKHINFFPDNIDFINLPSSSPAYTLSYNKKLEIWRQYFYKYI